MKIIDKQSFIIGALGATLFFFFIGANQQHNNMGDIIVTSLRLVNDEGVVVAGLITNEYGAILRIGNKEGVAVADIEANEDGGGLGFATHEGTTITYLGAEQKGGTLGIFNNKGELGAHLAASETGSFLDMKGKQEKSIFRIYPNINGDGTISIYDRYGELGWVRTGKQ